MAAKRSDPPARELPEQIETDTEAQALEKVQQAIEADTGGAVWRVLTMRMAGPSKANDGKEVRINECGIEDLENLTDKIRREFGDGIYRFRVRRDGRNIRQWDVAIELSGAERIAFRRRIAALEAEPIPNLPVPMQQQGSQGGDIAAAIGAAMSESMRYQADMMRQMFERMTPPAPPADAMKGFGEMLLVFKSFQEALPRSEATTGLSMFEKGMSFAEKMMDRGGAEGPTTLLGVVREVLANPEIGGALKEIAKGAVRQHQAPPQQQRRPMQVPGPVAPGQRPPQQAPAPQPAPQQPGPMQSNEDRAIEYLIGQASMGAQPELLADTALQMIPPERLKLLDNLPEEQAVDMILQFYPGARPHRAWFTALIRAIYEPVEEGGEHARVESDDTPAQPAPIAP